MNETYLTPQLSIAQIQDLKTGESGSPPFNIRDAKPINIRLNRSAIVDGYAPLPIYTYIESSNWDADLNAGSCPYVKKVEKPEWRDKTFENALWLRD